MQDKGITAICAGIAAMPLLQHNSNENIFKLKYYNYYYPHHSL